MMILMENICRYLCTPETLSARAEDPRTFSSLCIPVSSPKLVNCSVHCKVNLGIEVKRIIKVTAELSDIFVIETQVSLHDILRLLEYQVVGVGG